MVNPGILDQRVLLQRRPAEPRDALGQPSAAWENVRWVWARVVPVGGREFFAAQQQQSEITLRVFIRTRAGIDSSMRLLWRNEPYEIDSAVPAWMDEGREGLELMCRHGVRDGR